MGATINEQFSSNPVWNVIDLVTGTAVGTWAQFPSGTCKLARFKADGDNTGEFLLSHEDETSNPLVGWPLAAGDDTGWVAVPTDEAGLAHFWFSGLSGTADRLYYWLQR